MADVWVPRRIVMASTRPGTAFSIKLAAVLLQDRTMALLDGIDELDAAAAPACRTNGLASSLAGETVRIVSCARTWEGRVIRAARLSNTGMSPHHVAGSADTYRADSAVELDAVLPMLRHVPRVIVEEFVEAQEYTYDTICAGGRTLFENISWYLPRPLLSKMHE
jgi:hypothetical protein